MIKHGNPPYLEASSRGDVRFSAFFARIVARGMRTIEDIYQTSKVFEDGSSPSNWKDGKGKRASNQDKLGPFYTQLWREYISENTYLIPILIEATGISDMFGKEGSCCQATSLWLIRQELINAQQVNFK